MNDDTNSLLNEISAAMYITCSETIKSKIKLEEILSNYKIERKSQEEMSNDIVEKAELFIEAIELEGFSPNTLKDYKMELRLFYTFVNRPVTRIATSDIRSYLSSCEDIISSTVGKKLFVLRSFFGWLVREEYLLKNPTLRINAPKKPKRINKGITIEELEKVRESCVSLRQRCLLEVAYSTAARLSELSNMKIEDIDFQEASMNVIGKGNKERTVFLSPKAMYHLEKYLESRNDNCNSLFITEKRPYREMTKSTIQREVRKIEKASNIKNRLTAHRIRHTFATLSMENGIELADLQSILGHENPSTTLIYAQVSESRKKQAHRRFHVQ